MPYYCTVPRCTSMAGKAKNVSFHQFPRDEELAKLWNRVLKRGKPYTKYSKVCSLHFKPEDYTITSVGKNKGQWRTLRKDAVPSQNLPSEEPGPQPRRYTSSWVPSSPSLVDPMVQQQMAQAIYMQTMLAMQAAGAAEPIASNDQPTHSETDPSPSGSSLSEIELLLRCKPDEQREETYQCTECSKCFKDPDVFILHKRIHSKGKPNSVEKENYSTNIQGRDETLRANPILANLLKSSMRLEPEGNILDASVLTVENQIMTALASNMEAYIRTLSSMLSNQSNVGVGEADHSEDEDENKELRDAMCEEACVEDNVSNSFRSSIVSNQSVNVAVGEADHSEDEDENKEELGDAMYDEACIEDNVSNSCRSSMQSNGVVNVAVSEADDENKEVLGDAMCEEACIEDNVSNSCRKFNADVDDEMKHVAQAEPECDSKVNELGVNDRCN